MLKTRSPPAWTQEAYRPPRIKNSICCPILGVPHPWLGGIPHPGWGYLTPGQGVPQSWLGGTPSLARVPLTWHCWGYTIPGWEYPIPGWGYPIPSQGTPHLTSLGLPHPWLGYPQPGTVYPLARTGYTFQEGTWDQSLGYPPEKTWDQWKYYEMEMG